MRIARAVAIVSGLFLAACQRADEVIGSPDLPEEFGPALDAGAGCAEIDGRYAWPFVAGQAQGFDAQGRMQALRHPEFLSLAMPARSDGELEVRKERVGAHKDLRFVMRPVAPKLGPQPPKPSERRFRDERWHCDGPWVVIREYEHPSAGAREEYAGTVMVGAKLARLANGDLALGQWLRVTGRSESLNPFGAHSVLRVRARDVVRWYWSRYARQPKG